MSVFGDQLADFARDLGRDTGQHIKAKIAAATEPLQAQIDGLTERLAALEAKPSIQDAGTWKSGAIYRPGDVASHAGSAWICHTAHVAGGGISHESFRLLVKRGRDGADARRVPHE